MIKPISKSEKIAFQIRDEILSDNFTVGSKLPVERELAKTFNSSQLTISKAISMLVAEGLVDKRHGSGNFIISKESLQNQKQTNICFLLGEIEGSPNPIWHKIYETFYLSSFGYDINIQSHIISGYSINREWVQNTDVIIAAISLNSRIVNEILSFEKPVIWLEEFVTDLPGSTVCFDNYAAGYQAAEHLISRDCQRLLYMTYPVGTKEDAFEYAPSRMRFQGFQDGVENFGKGECSCHYYSCTGDFSNFVPELQFYIDSKTPVDGILCFSDSIMPYAVKAAMQSNKKIPDDIKLIGIDGWDICNTFIPSLTTLRQPTQKIGKKTAEVLGEILGKNASESMVKFPPELIENESTQISSKISEITTVAG